MKRRSLAPLYIAVYAFVVLCMLILAASMPAGCALTNLSPREQAQVLVVDAVQSIEDTRQQYRDLYDMADPQNRRWLHTEIAPRLDDVLHTAQTASVPIKVWVETGQEPDDPEAAFDALKAALNKASLIMAQAAMRVEGE